MSAGKVFIICVVVFFIGLFAIDNGVQVQFLQTLLTFDAIVGALAGIAFLAKVCS